jgi:hypothetical protein
MLNGMNPRAENTVTDGCAIAVNESSLTSDASLSKLHETPALETPFQAFVVMSTVRQICKNGLTCECRKLDRAR